MADVYVNALTTISTEPTTTDSLVVVNRNTNEGKIIDYNLLADVILNKITSKQFSELTTTSKLLTGAINELDSDVSSLNSSLTAKFSLYTINVSTSSISGIASEIQTAFNNDQIPKNNTPFAINPSGSGWCIFGAASATNANFIGIRADGVYAKFVLSNGTCTGTQISF